MNISNGRAGACVGVATEQAKVRESLVELQCCIIVAIMDSDVVGTTAIVSVNVVRVGTFAVDDKVTFACEIGKSVEVLDDEDE